MRTELLLWHLTDNYPTNVLKHPQMPPKGRTATLEIVYKPPSYAIPVQQSTWRSGKPL